MIDSVDIQALRAICELCGQGKLRRTTIVTGDGFTRIREREREWYGEVYLLNWMVGNNL